MLERLGAGARVLGLDRDPWALDAAFRRIDEDSRVVFRQGAFGDLAHIAGEEGMLPLDGILLDLGVSSRQLDDPARGFTYRDDAPLDMRMDPELSVTAADLLEILSEEEIADVLWQGGEVRKSRRLAHIIARAREARPIRRSSDLRRLVAKTVPEHRINKELSRVFQALRIRVNDELGQLESALNASVEALRPGGRVVVISYHSLEDRMVKHFFRGQATGETPLPKFPVEMPGETRLLRVIGRKPVTPDEEEIADNPRARSARMRVAERIDESVDGDQDR
jgi:16S rRNA (cytosine1402-N4)-methyltransferase